MEPTDYKVNSPIYGTDDRSMEKQRSVGIVKVGVIIAGKSVARLWYKQKQLVGPTGSYVLINYISYRLRIHDLYILSQSVYFTR